jgi:hypothetical protein
MLAKNLTTGFVFIIEVIAAMLAIKIVVSKDWNNLWLERNSQLALLAYKSHSMVPWNLRNRWIFFFDQS